MVLRALAALLSAGLVATAAAGCGDTADAPVGRPTSAPVPARKAGPPLSHQVVRAREFAPGWLDYCPTLPGRKPARYDVNAPGGGTIPGWCETYFARRLLGDYITFVAHWDARAYRAGTGTVTFVYLVPRGSVPGAVTVPLLVRQSGPLPP